MDDDAAAGIAGAGTAARPDALDDIVSVALVPPAGAPDSEAAARQSALVEASRADRGALAALAGEQPWLTPDRPFACGHYLVTQGLRELTGGPELEVANVPAAFVEAAAELLQSLARYLVRGQGTLMPGQVVNLGERGGVVLIAATGPDDPRAGDHDRPPLRVAFLN